MIHIRFILLCLLPWIFQYACAQSPHIQSITVSDGLSQGFITTICQDSRGFLWIGTLDGLNRYDGYSIRRFSHQPFSKYSLSSSAYITVIREDHTGLLWIGTDECLYIFDPATERFFNMNDQVPQLPRQGVLQISEDKSGAIIVHMPGNQDSIGLFHITCPAQFDKQLRSGQQPLEGVGATRLIAPADIRVPIFLETCFHDSLVLVRDREGRGYLLKGPDFNLSPFDLLALPAADQSILWCKNDGFIFRRRLNDGRTTLTRPNDWSPLIQLEEGSRITFINTEKWLFKVNNNAFLQSSQADAAKKNEQFFKDFTPFLELPYNISTIYSDRSEVIWVGTGGHGLYKINLRNLAFQHYLPGASVYNFRQLPDGRIWPGKFHQNQVVNLATGQFEKAPWVSSFPKEYIYNVLPDHNGNLWFVTAGNITGKIGGIYFGEKASGKYRKLADIPVFKELVVEQLLEDHLGNVWVAAHDGHLFRCRPNATAIDHFNYTQALPETDKKLTVNAILEDPDGIIWIGSSKGLLRVSKAQEQSAPEFEILQHQPGNTKSLSWNWILCLYQDQTDPNLLWVGTRGGGLNVLNKSTGHFTHYTEMDGLTDNVVYGIVPDDDGNLWCSTNRGLSRFSPHSAHFINYYESDGLQDNEFNTSAFLRCKNGTLVFGGVNGITAFNPADIQMSRPPPPVVITNIKVLGNLLFPARENSPLAFAPFFEQILVLPFSENSISFEFAALDFANPATNQYRYKMQGVDHDWIGAGTAHTANYTSLPPGSYTFLVQAATADGVWNLQSASFHVVISPPWYRSWQAYCLYFLIGLGLARLYFPWRKGRRQEKYALQLEHLESERLKELDTFKNRLFANITHEFRTPLTIILGLAERLKKEKKKVDIEENASNIITQGSNLLDLVNQMLDLAKLETQGLTLHPIQGDLSAFLMFHIDSFSPFATYKGVHLNFETDVPELVMDFDPQRFRQILSNLLSNAIRHTPTDGKITVQLLLPTTDQAVLIISDSGEGITAEDLPYIFDRYYQGNSAEQKMGTGGIGLALTRELVLLAGGEISVKSAVGEGSTFTMTFPITNQSFLVKKENITALSIPNTFVKEQQAMAASGLPLLLIIEDNPVVAKYLGTFLSKHYRLLLAENGLKGVQMALEKIPDLIISDVMMPLKDGLEVTEILKNDIKSSHIPIILLTAKTEDKDRLDGLRRGGNAYLTKPFLEEELLLVLKNQLAFQQTWKKRYASFEQPGSAGQPTAVTDSIESKFKKEDEFIIELYQIFEEHYTDEHFKLEHLCRLTGMSSSQLHRKLTVLTDQPAMQMLRNYRLNKALELLQTRHELHVNEIAIMVGFPNPSQFSRMFSKAFGRSPSSIKNQSR